MVEKVSLYCVTDLLLCFGVNVRVGMKMVSREPGESQQVLDGLCGREFTLQEDTLHCTIFCTH